MVASGSWWQTVATSRGQHSGPCTSVHIVVGFCLRGVNRPAAAGKPCLMPPGGVWMIVSELGGGVSGRVVTLLQGRRLRVEEKNKGCYAAVV